MSEALRLARNARDHESAMYYTALAQAEALEAQTAAMQRANELAEANLHLTMVATGLVMPGEAKLVGTAPEVHHEGTPEEHVHDVEVWEHDDAIIQVRIELHKQRIAEILDLPKEKL